MVGDLQLLSKICKRLVRETKAGEQLNTRYSFPKNSGKLPGQGTQISIEVGRYNPPRPWLPVSPVYSSYHS